MIGSKLLKRMVSLLSAASVALTLTISPVGVSAFGDFSGGLGDIEDLFGEQKDNQEQVLESGDVDAPMLELADSGEYTIENRANKATSRLIMANLMNSYKDGKVQYAYDKIVIYGPNNPATPFKTLSRAASNYVIEAGSEVAAQGNITGPGQKLVTIEYTQTKPFDGGSVYYVELTTMSGTKSAKTPVTAPPIPKTEFPVDGDGKPAITVENNALGTSDTVTVLGVANGATMKVTYPSKWDTKTNGFGVDKTVTAKAVVDTPAIEADEEGNITAQPATYKIVATIAQLMPYPANTPWKNDVDSGNIGQIKVSLTEPGFAESDVEEVDVEEEPTSPDTVGNNVAIEDTIDIVRGVSGKASTLTFATYDTADNVFTTAEDLADPEKVYYQVGDKVNATVYTTADKSDPKPKVVTATVTARMLPTWDTENDELVPPTTPLRLSPSAKDGDIVTVRLIKKGFLQSEGVDVIGGMDMSKPTTPTSKNVVLTNKVINVEGGVFPTVKLTLTGDKEDLNSIDGNILRIYDSQTEGTLLAQATVPVAAKADTYEYVLVDKTVVDSYISGYSGTAPSLIPAHATAGDGYVLIEVSVLKGLMEDKTNPLVLRAQDVFATEAFGGRTSASAVDETITAKGEMFVTRVNIGKYTEIQQQQPVNQPQGSGDGSDPQTPAPTHTFSLDATVLSDTADAANRESDRFKAGFAKPSATGTLKAADVEAVYGEVSSTPKVMGIRIKTNATKGDEIEVYTDATLQTEVSLNTPVEYGTASAEYTFASPQDADEVKTYYIKYRKAGLLWSAKALTFKTVAIDGKTDLETITQPATPGVDKSEEDGYVVVTRGALGVADKIEVGFITSKAGAGELRLYAVDSSDTNKKTLLSGVTGNKVTGVKAGERRVVTLSVAKPNLPANVDTLLEITYQATNTLESDGQRFVVNKMADTLTPEATNAYNANKYAATDDEMYQKTTSIHSTSIHFDSRIPVEKNDSAADLDPTTGVPDANDMFKISKRTGEGIEDTAVIEVKTQTAGVIMYVLNNGATAASVAKYVGENTGVASDDIASTSGGSVKIGKEYIASVATTATIEELINVEDKGTIDPENNPTAQNIWIVLKAPNARNSQVFKIDVGTSAPQVGQAAIAASDIKVINNAVGDDYIVVTGLRAGYTAVVSYAGVAATSDDPAIPKEKIGELSNNTTAPTNPYLTIKSSDGGIALDKGPIKVEVSATGLTPGNATVADSEMAVKESGMPYKDSTTPYNFAATPVVTSLTGNVAKVSTVDGAIDVVNTRATQFTANDSIYIRPNVIPVGWMFELKINGVAIAPRIDSKNATLRTPYLSLEAGEEGEPTLAKVQEDWMAAWAKIAVSKTTKITATANTAYFYMNLDVPDTYSSTGAGNTDATISSQVVLWLTDPGSFNKNAPADTVHNKTAKGFKVAYEKIGEAQPLNVGTEKTAYGTDKFADRGYENVYFSYSNTGEVTITVLPAAFDKTIVATDDVTAPGEGEISVSNWARILVVDEHGTLSSSDIIEVHRITALPEDPIEIKFEYEPLEERIYDQLGEFTGNTGLKVYMERGVKPANQAGAIEVKLPQKGKIYKTATDYTNIGSGGDAFAVSFVPNFDGGSKVTVTNMPPMTMFKFYIDDKEVPYSVTNLEEEKDDKEFYVANTDIKFDTGGTYGYSLTTVGEDGEPIEEEGFKITSGTYVQAGDTDDNVTVKFNNYVDETTEFDSVVVSNIAEASTIVTLEAVDNNEGTVLYSKELRSEGAAGQVVFRGVGFLPEVMNTAEFDELIDPDENESPYDVTVRYELKAPGKVAATGAVDVWKADVAKVVNETTGEVTANEKVAALIKVSGILGSDIPEANTKEGTSGVTIFPGAEASVVKVNVATLTNTMTTASKMTATQEIEEVRFYDKGFDYTTAVTPEPTMLFNFTADGTATETGTGASSVGTFGEDLQINQGVLKGDDNDAAKRVVFMTVIIRDIGSGKLHESPTVKLSYVQTPKSEALPAAELMKIDEFVTEVATARADGGNDTEDKIMKAALNNKAITYVRGIDNDRMYIDNSVLTADQKIKVGDVLHVVEKTKSLGQEYIQYNEPVAQDGKSNGDVVDGIIKLKFERFSLDDSNLELSIKRLNRSWSDAIGFVSGTTEVGGVTQSTKITASNITAENNPTEAQASAAVENHKLLYAADSKVTISDDEGIKAGSRVTLYKAKQDVTLTGLNQLDIPGFVDTIVTVTQTTDDAAIEIPISKAVGTPVLVPDGATVDDESDGIAKTGALTAVVAEYGELDGEVIQIKAASEFSDFVAYDAHKKTLDLLDDDGTAKFHVFMTTNTRETKIDGDTDDVTYETPDDPTYLVIKKDTLVTEYMAKGVQIRLTPTTNSASYYATVNIANGKYSITPGGNSSSGPELTDPTTPLIIAEVDDGPALTGIAKKVNDIANSTDGMGLAVEMFFDSNLSEAGGADDPASRNSPAALEVEVGDIIIPLEGCTDLDTAINGLAKSVAGDPDPMINVQIALNGTVGTEWIQYSMKLTKTNLTDIEQTGNSPAISVTVSDMDNTEEGVKDYVTIKVLADSGIEDNTQVYVFSQTSGGDPALDVFLGKGIITEAKNIENGETIIELDEANIPVGATKLSVVFKVKNRLAVVQESEEIVEVEPVQAVAGEGATLIAGKDGYGMLIIEYLGGDNPTEKKLFNENMVGKISVKITVNSDTPIEEDYDEDMHEEYGYFFCEGDIFGDGLSDKDAVTVEIKEKGFSGTPADIATWWWSNMDSDFVTTDPTDE